MDILSVLRNRAAEVVLFTGVVSLSLLYYHFQQPFAWLTWYTCLFFYLSIFMVVAGALALLFRLLHVKRETAFKVWAVTISVFTVLFITEFFLRMMKINLSYMEIRGGVYRSAYIKYDKNVDWHYLPQSDGYLVAPEYKYARHHNNYGFSDADFNPHTNADTIVIQTYGDSFTEGDGAPADSSYPALLRKMLQRDGYKNIVVQNFGICGNDPAFCWRQLKDIGAAFKPNIAIIVYGTGDLTTDFFTRGGQERFKGDYYKGFDAPSWEWLYGVSYVARLVANSVFGVDYKNFFLTHDEAANRVENLKPKWNHTFADIASTSCGNNIKVLLIKKPEHSEVDNGKYDEDFKFFDRMKDSISCFKQYDLLPFYKDSFHLNKDNTRPYWWVQDGHHNPTGYAMMAQGIYTGLKQTYPEIFTTLDTTKTAR